MIFTIMYKILWQFALVPSRSLLQISQEPRLTVNHRVQKDTTSDCVEIPAKRLTVDRFALAQQVSVCSKTKTHCLSWLNRLDAPTRSAALFEANGVNFDDLARRFFAFGFGSRSLFNFHFCSSRHIDDVCRIESFRTACPFWSALKRTLVEICLGRNPNWSTVVFGNLWLFWIERERKVVSESTFDLLVA